MQAARSPRMIRRFIAVVSQLIHIRGSIGTDADSSSGLRLQTPPAAQGDRLDHRPYVAQSCDYDERQAGKEQQPRTEVK